MPSDILQHAKILIVDDAPLHVEVLTGLLQMGGYVHIRSTTKPRDALRLQDEFLPDLVILDLHMPGLGGLRVLEQMRASIFAGAGLPILVVTADPTIEARREALALGASDYVIKPYDSSEVRARVGNLLETRFLHQALARQNRELTAEVGQRRAAEEALRLERDELRAAKAEAERANAAKSEFLSHMSHELRTPLNAIIGFGQLLEMEGRDPEEADNLRQILKASRHLLVLVDALLALSIGEPEAP